VYSSKANGADYSAYFLITTLHREGFKMNFDYKRLLKFELNLDDKQKKYRLYAGIAALLISVFIASVPLLLIGLILTAEGYFGWCPLCSALDNKCKF
jgi:hypothetical protein